MDIDQHLMDVSWTMSFSKTEKKRNCEGSRTHPNNSQENGDESDGQIKCCYPGCNQTQNASKEKCFICTDLYHHNCKQSFEAGHDCEWSACYLCHPLRNEVTAKLQKLLEHDVSDAQRKTMALGSYNITFAREKLGEVITCFTHVFLHIQNEGTTLVLDPPPTLPDDGNFGDLVEGVFCWIKKVLYQFVVFFVYKDHKLETYTGMIEKAFRGECTPALNEGKSTHPSINTIASQDLANNNSSVVSNALEPAKKKNEGKSTHPSINSMNAHTHCPNIDDSQMKKQSPATVGNNVIPETDRKFNELIQKCHRVEDEALWSVLFLAAKMKVYRPDTAEQHVVSWEPSASGLIQIVAEYVFQKCLCLWEAKEFKPSNSSVRGEIIKTCVWVRLFIDLEGIIHLKGRRIAASILRRNKFQKWRDSVDKSQSLSKLASKRAVLIAKKISSGVYNYVFQGGVSLLQRCWERCQLEYTDRNQTACLIASKLSLHLDEMKSIKEKEERSRTGLVTYSSNQSIQLQP
jgi:hypothetical protein